MMRHVATAAVLALLVCPAFAADSATHKGAKSGEPHADGKFVHEAAQGGLLEVQLGQLAAKNGMSEQVKSFGQRMVDDHSKANQELMQIAQQKGITLKTSLDKKHQDMVDKLAKKSGKDFDKDYMDMMVKDHKDDVDEFQKEANTGKDADVKAFAAKTLPVLQEHHRMAEDTQKALSGK